MPTGRACAPRGRGFTYLVMLFVLAVGSAGLASLARAWSTAAALQLERESMFRGQAIADAIGRHRSLALPPGVDGGGPRDLEDLLDDRRAAALQRHLRRVWDDPLTGQPDWVLLRDGQGRIEALHSRSQRPALITRGLEARADGQALRHADRVFRPQPLAPAAAASAADAAASAATRPPAHPARPAAAARR